VDYTIRKSPRARHVWLRFTDSGELVVVLPRRFDVRRVPGVVASNREWIERAARRMATRRAATPQADPVTLPECIRLVAIGREWTVRYRITESSSVRVVERPGAVLDVSGATRDAEACRMALVRWLYRVANVHLVMRVRDTAAAAGFTVGRIAVRCQRTRWASCSRGGTISLNVRMLFVAPELARHVMLHELCHTVRMDHSTEFWSLLKEHDADWSDHRRRLKAAWREVPAWATTRIS
jgi:predicted metal-dependent hydrolase